MQKQHSQGVFERNIADITNKEFGRVQSLVYQTAGISLGKSKKALVVSRLSRYLKQNNLNHYDDLLDMLPNNNQLLSDVINSISTNVTYFFREQEHFDFLYDTIVPQATSQRTIKIWSAGCSTGEEPYSIAICVSEALKNLHLNIDIKILATDLSTNVIKKAQYGAYKPNAAKSIPMGTKKRYFDEEDGMLRIKKFIREMVTFRFFNLKSDIDLVERFDLIVCRNVMIYFDKVMRDHVLDIFYKALKPEGFLFIGHSESIYNSKINVKLIKPAIYRKR